MTNPRVALIVHSCDRYELLYQGFNFFFSKYWGSNAAVKCYFATEEIKVSFDNFAHIKSGKGEWSNRLSILLDQIEEDYIIYFQEDMWLSKAVDHSVLSRLIDLTIENQWKQVKLNSSSVFSTIKGETFLNGLNISKLNNAESGFLMSHQVTLWNKAFLKQQLLPNEHPWRNERKGTKRLKKLNPEIYHIDLFSENGSQPNNENQHLAAGSAYATVSLNATLNDKTPPFMEELKKENSMKEYAAKLQYNYTHQLTHDGKPKPLKKDLFKRLKNWINRK
jgi:hypothetical protein